MSEIYNMFFPETRNVARFEDGDLLVSTIWASDNEKGYETAISDPRYDNGHLIIVETYETEEEALLGHNKWATIMIDNPPEFLSDVSDCLIASMVTSLNNGEVQTYKKMEKF